jgi:molecular chaperone DnaK (HSP70)
VKDVLKLIEVQHKMSNSSSKFNSDREALDLIILTGGLGQSKYLQNRVKEKYQNIPVYTPAAYDQSVVRGAVALALNPNVATQRVASRSYGIEVMVPRDSGKSSMNQMISGLEFNSNIRYDNFVEWGTSIGTYEYYEKTFYVKYPNNTYAGKTWHR